MADQAKPGQKPEEPKEEKHVQFPSDFSAITAFQGARRTPFEVSLGSLDDPAITVFAQYRPKELQLDQTVPWSKHTNKSGDGAQQLEFSGADGRVMSVEFFFDASEEYKPELATVQPSIDALTTLASVRDPSSPKDEMKRPHRCVMCFGKVVGKHFRCVIESMSTKYTMFSPTGHPIRATVSLKLREAEVHASTRKEKAEQKAALAEARQEAKEAAERAKVFFAEAFKPAEEDPPKK